MSSLSSFGEINDLVRGEKERAIHPRGCRHFDSGTADICWVFRNGRVRDFGVGLGMGRSNGRGKGRIVWETGDWSVRWGRGWGRDRKGM